MTTLPQQELSAPTDTFIAESTTPTVLLHPQILPTGQHVVQAFSTDAM